MKNKFKKNVYLFSPVHRLFNYFLHADYIFKIEKLIVVSDLNLIKENFFEIFIDQSNFSRFLDHNFKNKKLKINILLWNDIRDYELHKFKIEKIKKKYNNVLVYSLSSFSIKKKNFIYLGNYKINNEQSLKQIHGINFIKKIKYYYSKIYSFYNFLRYFKSAKNFLNKEKVIFVGNAGITQIQDSIKKNFYRGKVSKSFNKIIINYQKTDSKNIDPIFSMFKEEKFRNLAFHHKYYFVNVIIRFILVTHLKKFNNFYHKDNSLYPLDLLFSTIYKKLYMLDVGSKVGNTNIYVRSILLNKFYKKRQLKLNFFKDDINYSSRNNFDNRLTLIKTSLKKILNYKNFNCSADSLKIKINEIILLLR
mgnify:CR=1 FL=1